MNSRIFGNFHQLNRKIRSLVNGSLIDQKNTLLVVKYGLSSILVSNQMEKTQVYLYS